MSEARWDGPHVQWIGAGGVGACGLMVQGGASRLLLDAGWRLGQQLDESVAPPDAIVVTHAHLDHCGAIAGALLEGTLPGVGDVDEPPKVWATPRTKALLGPVLATKDDVGNRQAQEVARRVRTVPMATWWHPTGTKETRAILLPAGHIAGAASVYVQVGSPAERAGVYYTGDFCTHDQPLTSGAQIPAGEDLDVDLLVTESILGDQTRLNELDVRREWRRLVDVSDSATGGVLVAAGSVGLAQEVFGALAGEVPRLAMHDSLADVTEAYVANDDPLSSTTCRIESESTLHRLLRGNNVVIAPGAQCESGTPAGRLARRAAQRQETTIVLLRDCYDRHFGGRLQDVERGDAQDRDDIRCQVETIYLPNHGTRRQVGDVASGLGAQDVWSVHGSDAARRSLCDHLSEVVPEASARPVETGTIWEVTE